MPPLRESSGLAVPLRSGARPSRRRDGRRYRAGESATSSEGWSSRLRDVGEDELLAQVFPVDRPRGRRRAGRCSGPGDDAAVVAAPAGGWSPRPTSLVEGRDLRDDGPARPTSGSRRRPRTSPTSPRWARCRPRCWCRAGRRPSSRSRGAGAGATVGARAAPGAGRRSWAATCRPRRPAWSSSRSPRWATSRAASRCCGRVPGPGDVVAVAGARPVRLGLALLGAGGPACHRGFRCPGPGRRAPPSGATPHHRRRPRGRRPRARGAAMVDVSDGLVADLGRVAPPAGCGSTSTATRSDRFAAGAARRRALGEADALHWVLAGGEDHALVATFPPRRRLPLACDAADGVAEPWRVSAGAARGRATACRVGGDVPLRAPTAPARDALLPGPTGQARRAANAAGRPPVGEPARAAVRQRGQRVTLPALRQEVHTLRRFGVAGRRPRARAGCWGSSDAWCGGASARCCDRSPAPCRRRRSWQPR